METSAYCHTGEGLRLSVVESRGAEPGARPLVFVHGYSQSTLCWRRQFAGDLARRYRLIAYDLRGHGMSDKPRDIAGYSLHRPWADDLRAVLDWFALEKAVLVGWSFGVEVIRDYLHFYGDAGLGGLVLVAGRTVPEQVGQGLLEEVPGLCSDKLAENIAATRRFIRNCSLAPLEDDDMLDFIAFNAMACLSARIGMRQREPLDPGELGRVGCPVLIVHGDQDRIIEPRAAASLQDLLPQARLLRYPQCGHLPFIEQQVRFERDLSQFVDGLRGDA